jgi:hypothetical protein
MNIIFGNNIEQIPDKYTILELDQFRLPPDGKIVSSYCIVDQIPLEELALLDHHRTLHNNCINGYRNRQWEFCEQALETLRGCWNSKLDTFYNHLADRIATLKNQTLSDDWCGIIDKDQSQF